MAKHMNDKIQQAEPRGIVVKVEIDNSEAGDRIYANHVELRVDPLDVTLVFCEIDGPRDLPSLSAGRKGTDPIKLKARPRVRVVLSHMVFESLASLMWNAKKKPDSKPGEEN